ncbi:MAG TPA: 2-oxoacid:ferredoxin oxidoreductase subunit alpha [Candidatus Sulfotelmatobacter sp.]|nr:2-oxoacid:ferredoxin oxidoreductase subunit alpha [Candidatus Sulfotelmatobacter sp.]
MKWTVVSALVPTAQTTKIVIVPSDATRPQEAEKMSRSAIKVNDLSWMTGGPQGSGVDSSANIFAGACVLGGLWTFGLREYYSSIKGPHSYFEVRVNGDKIRSHVNNVDILATFDAETLIRHAEEVPPGGGILYDPTFASVEIDKIDSIETPVVLRIQARLAKQGLPGTVSGILEEAKRRGVNLFSIPYNDIIAKTAAQIGEHQLSKLSRIVNVLSVSASFGILGFDEAYLNQSIERAFANKKKVVDMNEIGAKLAYDAAKSQLKEPFPFQLHPIQNQPRLLLMGVEAVALGKLVGGCRVQTYYPITPAADESEFLESHGNFDISGGNSPGQKGSILVTQTEDEIAAITMATGAALTGARAATSTSGPGFSLMVEGLGWAGMNEVPLVITHYQRGGPATGQPTRHEQGDLKFVLTAAHGEFPRIVLCSGDMEESFYDAIRIFNYAERFQMPSIHLIDKGLANNSMTISPPKGDLVPIQRGKLIQGDHQGNGDAEPYRRFAFTEDGVSPRAVLGMPGYRFWNTGDEHDEIGHIEEDPDNRVKMMTKRMTKLDTAAKEIPDEEKVNFFRSSKKQADITLVSWGSTKGPILDAIKLLEKDGIGVEFLQIRLVSPFPTDLVKQKLAGAKLLVDIEQNYSGQMAAVIAEKTMVDIKNKIVKFNGRPMSQDEIYQSVKQVISNPEQNRRVVLTHGA